MRYALRVASTRGVRDKDGVGILELRAASVWPLARPFHLADALGSNWYSEAPCPILRLSSIHEQTIRKGGWLDTILVPVDRPQIDEPVKELFHQLWTKGAMAPGYDKKEWSQLAGLLHDRGVHI
jgi:hypothetical protein